MDFSSCLKAPSELHFDYQNPRIAEFGPTENTPENEIIKILWTAMGVEEIILSIKASGFFNNEPLIAILDKDRYIVIEGNRRLAAIKCILDPTLADFIGVNKNSFLVNSEIKAALDMIPIIVVKKERMHGNLLVLNI